MPPTPLDSCMSLFFVFGLGVDLMKATWGSSSSAS